MFRKTNFYIVFTETYIKNPIIIGLNEFSRECTMHIAVWYILVIPAQWFLPLRGAVVE